MALSVEKKSEIMREFGKSENDTGSPEVQIALLSANITTSERREYPEPIVNHKFQQETFKSKYKLFANASWLLGPG